MTDHEPTAAHLGRPRRAVYRALMGRYEELREEEVARESDLPFICFTDDPDLTSETWQVVHVPARFPGDVTRSARALKIVGHPALEDYDETLWVDNTVELRRAPDELFDLWLTDDAEVAAPLHSFRSSVLAEAEAVVDSGRDDFARVYEQVAHYLAHDAGVLEENPHWTGILARRRTPRTTAAMQSWWEDVLRYSRRDQLSFVRAVREHDVRLRSVEIDSLESMWHAWPRAQGRREAGAGSGLRAALRPPSSRVGELEQSLDDATHALATAVAQREAVIEPLERALTDARREADELRDELDQVRHERNLASAELAEARTTTERLEVRVSTLTRRSRRLRRRVRRLREQAERPVGWRARVPWRR